MWGIVLGVGALVLAAYELLSRSSRAYAGGAVQQAGGVAAAAAIVARNRAAALSCGLQDGDMTRTQAWLIETFGVGVNVQTGLALLPNRQPPDTWPDFVRRAACYVSRSGA